MNWDQVQGNWTRIQGSVREHWGKLTDQDLEQIAGKKDRLLGALKVRYGMEAEKATAEVSRWLDELERKLTKS
jgi:uncharacterized protein YjbJ (UPF0337 family)